MTTTDHSRNIAEARGVIASLKAGLAAPLLLLVLAFAAACYPVDTGGESRFAIMQIDEELYAMRQETAILQEQIDSLVQELRKTDSLLRWVANLTGNPIPSPYPVYIPPPE